jgi:hypothetical protein
MFCGTNRRNKMVLMKIYKRIKIGKLKGWTIRVARSGWYDLYSDSGVSQTTFKHTLPEIIDIVKVMQK